MNNIDLFELDGEWKAEHRELIGQIKRFVDQEVLPKMAECHNKGTFPPEFINGIQQLGILEAIASNDLDPLSYGLVLRELERGSSGLRSFVSVQGSLVMSTIKSLGSPEQIEKYIVPMGKLETIGCFGLTEPDFGSNPSELRTNAKKEGDHFILNGAKCWITNGTFADVAIIWAQYKGKVCGFLVETDRPGFSARAIEGKWSFRSSDTAELALENVKIPLSNMMPKATSLGYALKSLNEARFGIAWGVIGAAAAALEETIRYLSERPQFNNRPLTVHQLIQSKLAWMSTDLTAMQLIAKRLSELKIAGKMTPYQISLAKMNNCRKALEITRTCRELMGANGIHNEYHIGRRMVDLETVLTYEGTEHIHSLVIGEHLTGEKAFA